MKHGDLETALNKTTKEVDVRMGTNGADMSCINCHKTERHLVTGKLYTVSSENSDRVSCEQCHTDRPHSNKILNEHISRVAWHVSLPTLKLDDFITVRSLNI